MSYIEIKNLTKRYDDILAVDNISFNIEKGSIFGLLGPNGAGKSTLISIICGLLKNDSGEVIVDGLNLSSSHLEIKKLIGFIPQDIAIFQKLSAYENLKFWGKMYGLKGPLLKRRINEALEVTGLENVGKKKSETFSGGMKRRLNIACAIMHHPDILIMDEPTVGVDPQSRNHILEFAKKLNKEFSTTVIYTSHYMEEIDSLCDNLLIMDKGKDVAYGHKKDIKKLVGSQNELEITVENFKDENIINLSTLSGVTNVKHEKNILKLNVQDKVFQLDKAISNLVNSDVKIKNISVNEPTLESVFLSLTGKSLRD